MGHILQIITAILGGSAIFLRSFNRFKGVSYIIGILSCPCWIATEVYYGQWLLLPVNLLYIYGWVRSYRDWRRNENV